MAITWLVPGSFDNGMGLGDIRSNINEFNTDVANWINTYEPLIDIMYLDIQDLKTDVTSLLLLVAALNTKVDGHQVAIIDLQSRMTIVEARITANEGSIASNAGRISTNEGDIANLENDLGVVENRVSINETDI